MSATITSTTIQTHEPSIAIQSEKKDSVIVTESELPLSNGHRIDRGNDHGSRYLVVSPYTEREHLLDHNPCGRYWFGDPDADGRNLATCVWRSRDDAKLGNVGPAHRKAAGATRAMYSNWRIDRHRLIIRDGIESWDIIDWVD